MTWKQFLDIKPNSESIAAVQTDIECPKCGRNIYFNKSVILTSYPSKYAYWCHCGWAGYAPIRWEKNGDHHD